MLTNVLILLSTSTFIAGSTVPLENDVAVLVTGGSPGLATAEALHGDGAPWCRLPDLPAGRAAHSQSALLSCGGFGTETSCVRLTAGGWRPGPALLRPRYHHCSWTSGRGTLLLGGRASGYTTELLAANTSVSTESFPLKYDTSLSCAIELDSKVIVTGGDTAPRQVTVYTLAGWAADLPSLRTSRWLHGCGHFVNSEDKQVYLVTGGFTNGGYLASTELLLEGGLGWEPAAPLPSPRAGLRAASVNNRVIVTGGHYLVGNNFDHDSILSFDPVTAQWSEVGVLTEPRRWHAVSVVRAADVREHCQPDLL